MTCGRTRQLARGISATLPVDMLKDTGAVDMPATLQGGTTAVDVDKGQATAKLQGVSAVRNP